MNKREPCPFSYRLVRSDRRTLALAVDERGELIARAPKRMPVYEIERFIREKERWIAAQREAAQARLRLEPPLRLIPGEALPYLGGTLRLAFADVRAAGAQGGTLTLPAAGDPVQSLRRWLEGEATRVLKPRVTEWARVTGLLPKRLAWSVARKRWGSMSSDGTLRLNLGLLLCPMEAIDYVIVHELAHIAHPDHSPAFHALVRRYLPDADARRRRMQDMSSRLTVWKGADHEQPNL